MYLDWSDLDHVVLRIDTLGGRLFPRLHSRHDEVAWRIFDALAVSGLGRGFPRRGCQSAVPGPYEHPRVIVRPKACQREGSQESSPSAAGLHDEEAVIRRHHFDVFPLAEGAVERDQLHNEPATTPYPARPSLDSTTEQHPVSCWGVSRGRLRRHLCDLRPPGTPRLRRRLLSGLTMTGFAPTSHRCLRAPPAARQTAPPTA